MGRIEAYIGAKGIECVTIKQLNFSHPLQAEQMQQLESYFVREREREKGKYII